MCHPAFDWGRLQVNVGTQTLDEYYWNIVRTPNRPAYRYLGVMFRELIRRDRVQAVFFYYDTYLHTYNIK